MRAGQAAMAKLSRLVAGVSDGETKDGDGCPGGVGYEEGGLGCGACVWALADEGRKNPVGQVYAEEVCPVADQMMCLD